MENNMEKFADKLKMSLKETLNISGIWIKYEECGGGFGLSILYKFKGRDFAYMSKLPHCEIAEKKIAINRITRRIFECIMQDGEND